MAEIQGQCEPGFEAVRGAFAKNFDDGLEDGASICVYQDGRPVVDLLWQAGMRAVSVTITSGQRVTGGLNSWRVPKRDLVTNLQVLLQSHRLRIAADLPLADALADEMLDFRVRVSDAGHDSWGGRDHDDLVLALAVACWLGERAMPRVAAAPSGGFTESERHAV